MLQIHPVEYILQIDEKGIQRFAAISGIGQNFPLAQK